MAYLSGLLLATLTLLASNYLTTPSSAAAEITKTVSNDQIACTTCENEPMPSPPPPVLPECPPPPLPSPPPQMPSPPPPPAMPEYSPPPPVNPAPPPPMVKPAPPPPMVKPAPPPPMVKPAPPPPMVVRPAPPPPDPPTVKPYPPVEPRGGGFYATPQYGYAPYFTDGYTHPPPSSAFSAVLQQPTVFSTFLTLTLMCLF